MVGDPAESPTRLTGWIRWIGLVTAPIIALITYAALPDSYRDASGAAVAFAPAGRATAAVAVWMATWWMTEAISIYATALLPLCLLPISGATSMRQAAAPYGHELIFLFMGGFILALSMQRWELDRRISLHGLRLAGTRPATIVATFMGITALLSMWVSNTATSVMMLPIALGVIDLVGRNAAGATPDDPRRRAFSISLLLGIAYAASIGGVGTIVGTPPNVFLASYAARELGVEISFARWMAIGLPLVALFLPMVWLLLTRFLFRTGSLEVEGGRRHVDEQIEGLGAIKRGEWVTLVVFSLTATAWVTRPLWLDLEIAGATPFAGVTDAGIAITAALVLFVVPTDVTKRQFTMDWATAVRLPWGLLILFGGGLSLAAAIRANGLGEYLGHSIGFMAGVPVVVVLIGVVTLMIFLTEITSNTATAATMIPILAGLAPGLGMHPLLLAVPAAIAASCAFMLPVATPPNAVVFGSGLIPLSQMSRAGFVLNLIGIVLITGLCYALALPLLTPGTSAGS